MSGDQKTLQLVIEKPIELRVSNSSLCTEQSRSSEIVYVGGIPWKMYAHIDHMSRTDSSRWLNVFLVCCWEIESSWIIDISTVVRVVRDGSQREKRVDVSLRNTSPTVSFEKFMRWQEIFLSQFVNDNDQLKLEIDLEINAINTLIRDPYDFQGPGDQGSDFRIVLNGRALHVDAKILAIHAKYFKKMVQNGRRELRIDNEEIGLSYEIFETFLQLIHGNKSVINGHNLCNLLLISQLFQCLTAEQLLAQFLLRSKHIDIADKILLTKSFKLKSVQKVLIRSINEKEDFDKILAKMDIGDARQKEKIDKEFDKMMKKKRKFDKKSMGTRSVQEVIECELDSTKTDPSFRGRWKEVWVSNIPFLFGIQLHNIENIRFERERFFRVYVECLLDKTTNWSLDITTVIQLKCHGDVGTSELAKATRTLTHFQPRFEGLIPNVQQSFQTRLMLKGEFSVRKIKCPLFPNKSKYWKAPGTFTDIALKVGGAKFYVTKELLATESPYFHVLFYHSFIEKDQSKITLEGIDALEFEELLHCVYFPQRPITRETVEFLLKLADYMDFQSVLKRCDWYLRNTRDFTKGEKQFFATQYRLENTLIECDIDLQYLTLHCGISDRAQSMITHILEAQHRARALQ